MLHLPSDMRAAVSIRGLVKEYPQAETPAVNGLDLDVEEGGFYGLLGPNGAGKTTTISILCGLLPATAGEVMLMGHQLPKKRAEVKHLIGIVPQDIALYDSLSAMENLSFFGKMYGLPKKLVKTRSEELLHDFGLLEKADKRVDTYSGGMKRRVNLMIGLMHRPQVLFLDEPTVGIDVQSRAMINDHLHQLNHDGMTIIYTSHHMDEAERMCDRIGIIDRGRLIADGQPKQLLSENPECTTLEDLFLKITGKQLRD